MKLVCAILALIVGAGSAGAAETRQPIARWVVNFDAAQCVASRDYGTAQDRLTMVLKAPPLGNVIQFGIIRSGRGGIYAQQLEGNVIFDLRPPLPTSVLAFSNKETKQQVYLINLLTEQFAFARTATVVALRAGRELDERFATSAIEPLMKVIDDCVADLRKVWNVPQGEGLSPNLKEAVSGNLSGVLKSDDYPAVALDKGQSGMATLALLVDENGKVADCTIVGTSGAAALDAQSCSLLKKRARFKPAIGLDGKPAKGSFIQRITWRTK